MMLNPIYHHTMHYVHIYIYMPICSGLRMYNIYTQNHPTADG